MLKRKEINSQWDSVVNRGKMGDVGEGDKVVTRGWIGTEIGRLRQKQLWDQKSKTLPSWRVKNSPEKLHLNIIQIGFKD